MRKICLQAFSNHHKRIPPVDQALSHAISLCTVIAEPLGLALYENSIDSRIPYKEILSIYS